MREERYLAHHHGCVWGCVSQAVWLRGGRSKHKRLSDASLALLCLASPGGAGRKRWKLPLWLTGLSQGPVPSVVPLGPMTLPVSEQVHNHFRRYEVEYLQFAFRWMNNLLMRELPLRCTIRLWDTYQVWRDPCTLHAGPSLGSPAPRPAGADCSEAPHPVSISVSASVSWAGPLQNLPRPLCAQPLKGALCSVPALQEAGNREAQSQLLVRAWRPNCSFPSQSEPEGFSHFHLYVCAAFLIKWRKEILDEEDFQVGGQEPSLGRGELQGGSYPVHGAVQIEGATAGTWLGRGKQAGCSEGVAPPGWQNGQVNGTQSSSGWKRVSGPEMLQSS